MRNNICQREEKQCPQGQGKAVSESKSAHCQTYVKNHALHLIKLNQLNYPGHCRAVGCLQGRFLPSVSQWKSRHLPFPHQEMCRQVKNIFDLRIVQVIGKVQILRKQKLHRNHSKSSLVFKGQFKEEKPFLQTSHGSPVPRNKKNQFLNNHLHKSMLTGRSFKPLFPTKGRL